MSTPGLFEWLIIAGIVVLLFGVNKLPALGGAIGETIKNFKKGIKEDDKTVTAEKHPEKKLPPTGHDPESKS